MNKYEKALDNLSNKINSEYDIKLIKELVEKEKPKKPLYNIENDLEWNSCPNCHYEVYNDLYDENDTLLDGERCLRCGQKLDWS